VFLDKHTIGPLIVCTLLTVSCLKPSTEPADNAAGSREAAAIEQTPETSPMLKRKRATLLRNTLAKVLNLNPQGMCLELGRLPCVDLVHKVSLGGINAYGNAQYHYPDQATITSPIALDRVVLSACIQRAQIDLLNPAQAVIFKDIRLSADGRLVRDEAIPNSIRNLYQRAFLREPTSSEVDALVKLYEDIYAEQPIGASVNWMSLSCYAVLTSVEAAFD
jgi:hypothetical protein